MQVNSGFDAYSAARFVQSASRFESHISLVIGEKTANAKSIMGIISLDLHAGGEIRIEASGADENEAINELVDLLTGTS